jgi:hypothetical protein
MDTIDHVDVVARTPRRRLVGVAGWAATVLLFGAQGFLQGSGTAEPAFDAPAAEIQRYFDTRQPTLFAVGSYLQVLGLIALLWFVCGLSAVLRRPATRPDWLPTVALASGTAAVGAILLGAWEAARFRVGDGLDPELARYAFDLGNLTFANVWVALGSLGIASGCAILVTRAEPYWLGWWAVVAGVGLVAARAVWTTSMWLIPYALFWLWVLVISTRLLRSKDEAVRAGQTSPVAR